MKNLKNILAVLKTIGEPVFEQHKKLIEGVITIQERIVIELPSKLNELDIYQISNFCKTFNFKCDVISIGKDFHRGFQLQLFENEEEE